MKIITQTRITLLLIFLLLNSLTFSQVDPAKKWKSWSVNVNGGVSLFYGDIENYRFYKSFSNNSEWRFGYGGMLQKQFSPLFTLRGQLYYGKLSGTKRVANKWFEGDVIETSLSLKLDFINLFWGAKERKFSLYGMAGVGLAQWRTTLMDFTTDEPIGGNGEDGSGFSGRTLEGVIPLGLGVEYNINENWVINLEGSLRPVNSDVLDANEGGFQFDFISYNFVGVTYKFVKRDKSPVLPAKSLAVEEIPVEQIEEVEEPVEEVVVVPPKPVKTIDEKLLAAEAETGMYESPWPDVEFAVQVAASKKISDPVLFEKKFDLGGEVNVNQGNGWYRFSVGRFIKYWRAKEYRNILVTRNGIDGAFVVAYRQGKRIMLHDLISSGEATIAGAEPEVDRPTFTKAFSVQVLASKDGNIPVRVIREMYEIDLEVFKELNQTDGTYQYSVGNFSTYEDAAKIRNKLKARGLRGAFVVGYKDGQRVSDIKTILD